MLSIEEVRCLYDASTIRSSALLDFRRSRRSLIAFVRVRNKSSPYGSNAERMRTLNLSAVFGHVHRTGGSTRSELALATGLSRSTIKALVEELIVRRLVIERQGRAAGIAGRPSTLVTPRADAVNVLAIEIAVDTVSAAIAGAGATLGRVVRIPRPAASAGPEATVHLVREVVQPLAAEIEANGAVLAGVGVSIYGLVSSESVVSVAPNLGWHEVPLADLIREALGVAVPVLLGNDANLGALAEHRRSPALDNLVFISGEVGVGGGIISDGRMLHGVARSGGEVGHMCVNPDGALCGCGSYGCWETEIGELALLRHAGKTEGEDRRRAVLAVLRAAELGDPEALRAVGTVARWLGIGLAGIINIFAPEQVVLGGFFARAYPLLREVVDQELAQRVLQPLRNVTLRTPFVEDASLLGAAELALDALLSDPTVVPLREDVA